MKINTHTLNVSASRHYAELTQTHVTRQFSFQGALNQAQAQRLGSPTPQGGEAAASQWVIPVTLQGISGLTLKQEFQEELTRLRQILDEILSTLAQAFQPSAQTRLRQVTTLYAQGIQLPSQTMAFTQTTHQVRTISETTQFQAAGQVHTADGRTLDLCLDLTMAHSQTHSFQMEQKLVFNDPLVVHTRAQAPALSGVEFAFDLDMDGEAEDLALPLPGTGFLSLDKNKDGTINDGSELFGPSSGYGFLELAEHDLDKNSWIDENDEIYDQLTLWEPHAKEGRRLTRIRDAGIGAIYLETVDTPFDLRDDTGRTRARVKRSSMALTEQGQPLAVQEVEWTV